MYLYLLMIQCFIIINAWRITKVHYFFSVFKRHRKDYFKINDKTNDFSLLF